ncbi:MAG TPA: hypothetical protein ENK84_07295 [Desulfobulbus sp.]|nr:hypothetical protein [Desulfobulbus sp.]HHD63593.1 hypothetical protein [Desulfobulbaceae bacterium]
MAFIIFYEKPGCINGGKQKKILIRAGNILECRNILTYPWSTDNLQPFIAGKRPQDIMNYTAPAIKEEKINPVNLSIEEAVALMVSDPILIKRPLIEVDALFIQGFDHPELKPYLGEWDSSEDVITCPNLQTLSCDDQQKEEKP